MYKVKNPIKIQISNPRALEGKFQQFDMDALRSIATRIENISAKSSKLSTTARLKNLLDWVSDVLRPFESINVCEKGCAHCCVVPVNISETEAQLISRASGISINPFSKAKRAPISESQKSEPCPMLNKKTATCSVYNERPLVCRTFMAFDSFEFCKEKTLEHAIIKEPESILGIIDSVNDKVGGNTAMQLYEAVKELTLNTETTLDIRQYFNSPQRSN